MNHISQDYDGFKELGRERCPVCGHSDRCKANRSRSCIVCFRCREEHSNGFQRIKENAQCCVYVLPDPKADRNGQPDGETRGRTWGKPILAPNAAADRLATELGVSVESLRALDLHIRDVPFHGLCPCFPERDGDGRIIGYNARLPNGKKKVGLREKRGLYIPIRLDELPDPVLAVEGGSDTSAGITMGLTVVGRPNDKGGVQQLAKLLADRATIIVGENDDGAGVAGARETARKLAEIWGKSVRWSLPPEGFKDIREYLLSRTDEAPIQVGRELLEHLESNAIEAFAPIMKPPIDSNDNSSNSSNSCGMRRKWPEPLDEVAFYGVAGELVRRIEPNTEADPVALLVSFLVAFGNLIGRTTYFVADGARHYCNLFAVLIGETSKGRKGTAWARVLQNLLVSASQANQWAETRVTGGLSSGEGLIWNVRDPIYGVERDKKTKTTETVLIDPGETDKRLMVVEPEYASVLRIAERPGNTLSPILRKAWESGDLRALTKNSPAKATGAHISIIGHATDEEARRYLSTTEVANGFANRFIWLCVKRSKCLPEGGAIDDHAFADLMPRIAASIAFASSEQQLVRDQAAKELWAKVYPDLSEGKPGLAGSMTGRAEAQVMRLAMIFAVLDCSPVIRVEHLAAATALWEYCEASVIWCFGDATGNPIADAILEGLRSTAPGGLTRTEISHLLGKNESADRILAALALLKTRRLAHSIDEKTDGRTAERWFLYSPRGPK